MISYNNNLILEPYKGKRGLKSTGEKQGFAQVQQKTTLVGLKLLADAQLSLPNPSSSEAFVEDNRVILDSNFLKKGQVLFFKEEDLHNSDWASRVYTSNAFKNGFVIGNITNMVMIK